MLDKALRKLVADLVASGAVTAVAAVVGDGQSILAQARGGWRDAGQKMPVRRWDRFDLASLSKPWVATLALRLDQAGLLPLRAAIGELLPQAPLELARQELQALLRHRSGLIAWRPLYRQLLGPQRAIEGILGNDSLGAPAGTYSDLGYIVWQAAAEAAIGASLCELLSRHVYQPLRLSTVGSAPAPDRAVACALDNSREVELAANLGVRVARAEPGPVGVVQDGNARYLGGLAGHAGLFASAHALWRLGAEWLRPGPFLEPAVVARALAGSGRRRLGWWRKTAAAAATGPLSSDSFGHHGFTGGSLWIDPQRQRVAVLMAQRSAVSVDLDPWRRDFHRLVVAS